jgi:L-aminopeptidase/D-esterase-like protein
LKKHPGYTGSITDIAGIKVGHYTDTRNGTGCTVVLSDEPATAGIEVRGAAPGSRETELLHPLAAAQWVNGIMLTGGSVFGLDAPGGVIRYLEENGVGLQFGRVRIPLVPAAVVFDLSFISSDVRPTAENGYAAAAAAQQQFERGSVGVGTGCTVGKTLGAGRSVKGGVGTCSVRLTDVSKVGALVAVNAIGDVVDPADGVPIAAPLDETGHAYRSTIDILLSEPPKPRSFFRNTVIGVIATDAKLDKIGASRLAIAAQDGIALAVRPAHTQNDGDTVFALATGKHGGPANLDALHAAALQAMSGAVIDAVLSATSLGGVKAVRDLPMGGQLMERWNG